jgi:catecholate siderophore receptor
VSLPSVILRSALLASTAFALATPAHADDADDRDYLPRDIVVIGTQMDYASDDGSTGTKTPTALIDVPQTVGVITRDQLDDQGVRQLAEALRYMPGVSIESGEGHRDQVFIRGQSTSADFYLDGLRDDAQYYRPLYNVDRVEVLKGANALIFGRGGGGGVINRVSKKADPAEDFASLGATIDSFGGWTLAGDANLPLSMSAAFRLNAAYEEFNNQRDFFAGRFIGISPGLTADLGESSRLTLNYTYDDDSRVTDRGLPSLNNLPLKGFDNTFFGDRDFNRATSQVHIMRARFDTELSEGLSLNASGQYANYDKFYANIVPSSTNGTTVTLSGYDSATQRENLIGQVNLVAQFDTGTLGHTLLLGAEAASQSTDADRHQARFAGNATSVTVPLMEVISVPAFILQAQRASTSDLSTFSAYIQDQLQLTEFLQLVGGVRYDVFDLDSEDLIGGFVGQRSDRQWSPRFGIIVKPRDTLSLYASYSKSFLPQSGDQFTVLDAQDVSLDPESFENFELGLKWAIAPELFLTASVFRLDRSNTTAADPANPGFVVLTGSSRVEGAEFSLAGAITPELHVSLGYTYLDGAIRSDTTAAPSGTRLQQLPESQASAWARYDLTDQLGIGLGVIHQSSQFASISNTVTLPGYTRVDAAIYLDELIENVSLQLNVENLFDAAYYPSAHGNNNIQPGEPFNATLSARVRF